MISRGRRVEGPRVLSAVADFPISGPAPGELLIRIHATSLNFHDLIGIAGQLHNLKVPRVPFSDAVGTVLAAGDGVTRFREGDRVIPGFFPLWQAGAPNSHAMSQITGDQIDGGLQTHLCVREPSVALAPEYLSNEEAATLACAGLTAWRSLVVEAQLCPGQTVVLQGTGGVSLFALQFAKLLGARVIITSSSDEKLERARALGADVLLNYRRDPDWDRGVVEHTNGQGADLVVDVGGGNAIGRSVNALKIGGHLSIIGVLAGFEAASFPLASVMAKNLHLAGITVGSVKDLSDMCKAIEFSGLRPIIDSKFELDTADQAMDKMKLQDHFGKIVITTA